MSIAATGMLRQGHKDTVAQCNSLLSNTSLSGQLYSAADGGGVA